MNISEVQSAFRAESYKSRADGSVEGIDDLQARLEARKNEFLGRTSDDEVKQQIADLATRELWSFSMAMLMLVVSQKVKAN
jgi:hypothetical protein